MILWKDVNWYCEKMKRLKVILWKDKKLILWKDEVIFWKNEKWYCEKINSDIVKKKMKGNIVKRCKVILWKDEKIKSDIVER